MAAEKAQHELMIKGCVADAGRWVCFCDGSALRNPGPGGAAALLIVNADQKEAVRTKVFSAVGAVTNNQMELKGLELALDLLDQQQLIKKRAKCTIFTDSQYVRGLFERNYNANKNVELIRALKARLATYRDSTQITIRWVRAHCGLAFNDRVDKLARAAASSSASSNTPGKRKSPASRDLSTSRNFPTSLPTSRSASHHPYTDLKRRKP